MEAIEQRIAELVKAEENWVKQVLLLREQLRNAETLLVSIRAALSELRAIKDKCAICSEDRKIDKAEG